MNTERTPRNLAFNWRWSPSQKVTNELVVDNWKMRRNITVDLGLRWELKMTPTNPENQVRRPNQAFTIGAPGSTTLRWEKGDLYKSDINNWAPSIGFAWDPTGSGKTSVRANYRLAYDRINTFLFSSAVFQSSTHAVVDLIIEGWQLAGFMTIQTGRPFTVYSGATTMSNVVQTPASCSGCTKADGLVFDDPTQGLKFYFDAAQRAKFSGPAAGEFSNLGRNFFTGPGSFSMDLGILKRTAIRENHSLEFRVEFTNLTNTPTFGFPTATMTSSIFGRIRDSVISGSRKMQLGLKYSF